MLNLARKGGKEEPMEMKMVWEAAPEFSTPKAGEPHWPIAQGYRYEPCGCGQWVTRIFIGGNVYEVRVRSSIHQDCPHGHLMDKARMSVHPA